MELIHVAIVAGSILAICTLVGLVRGIELDEKSHLFGALVGGWVGVWVASFAGMGMIFFHFLGKLW